MLDALSQNIYHATLRDFIAQTLEEFTTIGHSFKYTRRGD